MNGAKSPFSSVTLWGAVITLIAFISVTFFGVEITPDEQAEGTMHMKTLVDAVGALVGWVMIVIGRFKADKKLQF